MNHLDSAIQLTIARLDARMRTLDEQMEVAERILSEMDEYNDVWEHETITDESSDDESLAETICYYTRDENRYYSDEDEDDFEDDETIVGDWEDPYVTPMRLIIPMDLEQGLEHLH